MKSPLKILGIYREEKYSNRAVEADRAIMDEVLLNFNSRLTTRFTSRFTKQLSKLNSEDVLILKKPSEDLNLDSLNIEWDLIFSMAQDEHVLSQLEKLESTSTVLVVNSSKSVRNCFRTKLSELLNEKNMSYPTSVTLKTQNHEAEFLDSLFYSENGYWVKRGDFHALVDEDVVYVDSVVKLSQVLFNFHQRGVPEVVLQENCMGELFKFYGVRDHFFNLRYMGKTCNDRYLFQPGNPEIKFDRNKLEKMVHLAAEALELDYFGGDCIVAESGEMHFIDFNDWPSFRTCRDEAAKVMANYALKKINLEDIHASNFVQ